MGEESAPYAPLLNDPSPPIALICPNAGATVHISGIVLMYQQIQGAKLKLSDYIEPLLAQQEMLIICF